jgi:hypothetical protein
VRRRAPGLGSIGSTVLVIAAFVVTADALALRAQLFAIVLFAATLYVLAIRSDRPRAMWLIPVIAVVWANLHGTFLFVPALCGLAWLADLYELAGSSTGERQHRARDVHRMLIVGLVATAATLVNPFGPAVWGYVANLTSNPAVASRVTEWQPPSPTTVPGALLWLSVLGVAVLALVRVRRVWRSRDAASPHWSGAFRSRVHIPWPGLLTLALFGGFALASGRGTAWWPFAAAFVIAPWLVPNRAGAAAVESPPPEPSPTPRTFRRLNALMVGILAIVAIALLPIWRPIGAVGVPAGTVSYAPQAIASRLEVLCHPGVNPPRPVWNPQVWGSWLEFAAPCHTYATDSRIELFAPDVWSDIDAVEFAAPGWEDILMRRGAALVVTDHATDGALEAALLASPVWSQFYTDDDGAIWGRVPAGD